MALPLDSHPLYYQRKTSIIIAVIGLILSILAFWSIGFLTGLFLAASIVFCLADLVLYACEKVKDPDNDPKWPTRRWMFGDAVVAVVLQIVFWAALSHLMWYYGNPVLQAYSALTACICSIFHAWSCWKQLMARSKKRWLANLPPQPCLRCGYGEPCVQPTGAGSQTRKSRPNTFAYAGPSAKFHQASVLTPDSLDSALEEGLLIGSDNGEGYGAIVDPEPILEQPEEVSVGKGKKKKQVNNTVE